MSRAFLALATCLAVALPGSAGAQMQDPLFNDPLGPIVDVTRRWQDYQPARTFCVSPDVFEASGDDGADTNGRHPACRRSGFARSSRDLYLVRVAAPPLCAGCRRLFIDYSKIPRRNAPPYFYARGHVYFRLQSWNWGYTVDPKAHSPNIKNLTNDKAVAPDGSYQERIAHPFDLHAMSYVGDTAHVAHSQVQGPYYVGPWYLSRSGKRIHGAYLDVDVMSTPELPHPMLNEIRYMAGYNAGEATCPDNVLFEGQYADGNYGYAGCADRPGGSATGVNPFD